MFNSHVNVSHRPSREIPIPKPRLPQLENISINDFQCQAVLGRGHFGKVTFNIFTTNITDNDSF